MNAGTALRDARLRRQAAMTRHSLVRADVGRIEASLAAARRDMDAATDEVAAANAAVEAAEACAPDRGACRNPICGAPLGCQRRDCAMRKEPADAR